MEQQLPPRQSTQSGGAQQVITPSVASVERKRQYEEDAQEGSNFIGSSMPTESVSERAHSFLKRQRSVFIGLAVMLLGLFILTFFFNVPALLIFLASCVFVCAIVWALFSIFSY